MRTQGFLLMVLLLVALPLYAQRTGVGVQFGAPSGLTVKYYGQTAIYQATAAWDLGDFFFLQAHRLLVEAPLPPESELPLQYFMGPGALVGFRKNEVVLGLSGNFGLNYFIQQQMEVFLQLTPRLELLPATRGHLGGGLGFRYYWR